MRGIKDDILEIRMQSNMIDCFICGGPDYHHWSVPIYNGDIVSNDFPKEMWERGGGGQAVCESCYLDHLYGRMETFDHFYTHPGPMGVDLHGGAGI